MAKGEAMIDRPPEYQMTCNCGMRITGTNENGLISLIKRHLDTGTWHSAYLLVNKLLPDCSTELEKIMKTSIAMRTDKTQ